MCGGGGVAAVVVTGGSLCGERASGHAHSAGSAAEAEGEEVTWRCPVRPFSFSRFALTKNGQKWTDADPDNVGCCRSRLSPRWRRGLVPRLAQELLPGRPSSSCELCGGPLWLTTALF